MGILRLLSDWLLCRLVDMMDMGKAAPLTLQRFF